LLEPNKTETIIASKIVIRQDRKMYDYAYLTESELKVLKPGKIIEKDDRKFKVCCIVKKTGFVSFKEIKK